MNCHFTLAYDDVVSLACAPSCGFRSIFFSFRTNAMSAGEDDQPPRLFRFPSHQSHVLSLAKMCKDSKEFADCVIQCGSSNEDVLRAHRLVLGAASNFLKNLFEEVKRACNSSRGCVGHHCAGRVLSLEGAMYTLISPPFRFPAAWPKPPWLCRASGGTSWRPCSISSTRER